MDEAKLKELLLRYATGTDFCAKTDFNPADYAGGNFDDAFSLGYDNGQLNLARLILEDFYNEIVKDKC